MHSNSRQLTLRDITLKTTANYRCEVSAEAPSFASAQDGGRMEVICKQSSESVSIHFSVDADCGLK